MTAKPLLPHTFWFRYAARCPRVESIPRADVRGGLLGLNESCALPDLNAIDGRQGWARVRAGWNARGLGIAVLADGVTNEQLAPGRPEGFASVHLWVDTRDSRNVSRATRFCHHFRVQLSISEPGRQLKVEVSQRPIARATGDAPLGQASLIKARADLGKASWLLEVFLPAQCLNGFDPETNRRLGFAYQVADTIRDEQYLGAGREFPIGENPSLWSTLELRD